MKQYIIIFNIFILFFKLNGQITVLRLNDRDFEAVKKTTTYFEIPEFDIDKKQQYVDLIEKIWTFTPIKVVTPKEAEAIKNDVSISRIKPIATQVSEGPGVVYFYEYKMFMYYIGKNKQELVEKEIVWADFCIKHNAIEELHKKKGDKASQGSYIEKNNVAHNFSLGFIKNYFQWINNNIRDNTGEVLALSKRRDKEKLASLKTNDTLFIPDYVAEYPETNMEEALSKANFKYKIIPVSELNNKILFSKTPIYYLNFVRFGYNKGINIVNSLDGSFIFNNWNPMGFKFKNLTLLDDDVKIINGALK